MAFKSVSAFMNEIIDYAGIFPPASLTLKESFDNFMDYRLFKHNWILSKFVCPFSRLDELTELIDGSPSINNANPLRLTILGSLSLDTFMFERNILKDIQDIIKFHDTNGQKVSIEGFETKLPTEMLAFRESADLIDTINDFRDKIAKQISPSVQIFLETEIIKENWVDLIDSITSALSVCNEFYSEGQDYRKLGFKLRTGGIDHDSYPTSDKIAYAIMKSINNKVPFKATAGLHHAIRHINEQTNTLIHGFLNIFGAGILYQSKKISPDDMIKIIDDEQPQNFVFEDESFSWNGYKINTEEITFARKYYMLSFGSCSFEEPRQDLRNLKLL